MQTTTPNDSQQVTQSGLSVTAGSALRCAYCKRPMRKTMTGWEHAATGLKQCARADLAAVTKQVRAKVRWPNIGRDPEAVDHLRDILGRLNTPLMPNTRAAVIDCLTELHTRLLSEQNNADQRRG